MSRFSATEQRLQETSRKHRGFPRDAAAIVRLVKLLHKLTLDQGNDILRLHGLTYPEYNVLMMIDASVDGTLSPSLLGDAAGEKSANITRITTQLVEKGLIRRSPSPSDRRMWLLQLTARGERLIESFMPDIGAQLRRYTRHLDAASQRQLQALLKQLLLGVEEGA